MCQAETQCWAGGVRMTPASYPEPEPGSGREIWGGGGRKEPVYKLQDREEGRGPGRGPGGRRAGHEGLDGAAVVGVDVS